MGCPIIGVTSRCPVVAGDLSAELGHCCFDTRAKSPGILVGGDPKWSPEGDGDRMATERRRLGRF
jgi:hypothetical protein